MATAAYVCFGARRQDGRGKSGGRERWNGRQLDRWPNRGEARGGASRGRRRMRRRVAMVQRVVMLKVARVALLSRRRSTLDVRRPPRDARAKNRPRVCDDDDEQKIITREAGSPARAAATAAAVAEVAAQIARARVYARRHAAFRRRRPKNALQQQRQQPRDRQTMRLRATFRSRARFLAASARSGATLLFFDVQRRRSLIGGDNARRQKSRMQKRDSSSWAPTLADSRGR